MNPGRYPLTADMALGNLGGASLNSPAAVRARRSWLSSGAARLLLLFTALMWLQTAWAVNTTYNVDGAILFTKYVVLFFVLQQLLASPRTIELFAWAHVAGCFLWGWTGFTTDVSGRFEKVLGPGVDDANVLGFHLATGLAFAGLMALGLRGGRRLLAFAAIPIILNGIILTASRSAVVGLAAGGFAAIVWGAKAHRGRMILGAALGLVLVGLLAQDDLFWTRTATITAAAESDELDNSAASRIDIFKANWQMFLDHPMGAGHRGNEVLSPDYVDETLLTSTGQRSAHNTAIAALVDHGIPGILLWLALQYWALRVLWRLRKLDRQGWATSLGMYRGAAAAGLAAYWICGLFLNLLKAEAFIWLVALIAVLDQLAEHATDHADTSISPAS